VGNRVNTSHELLKQLSLFRRHDKEWIHSMRYVDASQRIRDNKQVRISSFKTCLSNSKRKLKSDSSFMNKEAASSILRRGTLGPIAVFTNRFRRQASNLSFSYLVSAYHMIASNAKPDIVMGKLQLQRQSKLKRRNNAVDLTIYQLLYREKTV
jgi:hypothetical protein